VAEGFEVVEADVGVVGVELGSRLEVSKAEAAQNVAVASAGSVDHQITFRKTAPSLRILSKLKRQSKK
jgi:hypothetical protein